jgi:phosphoribosylformylglycinamidine (FGAM) synthase-like enzyme
VKLEEEGPAEAAAFGERGARAVVSVTPSKLAAVLDTARQYNVAARELGQVTRDGSFRIEHKGRVVIDSFVETLRDAWAHSLERTLATG